MATLETFLTATYRYEYGVLCPEGVNGNEGGFDRNILTGIDADEACQAFLGSFIGHGYANSAFFSEPQPYLVGNGTIGSQRRAL